MLVEYLEKSMGEQWLNKLEYARSIWIHVWSLFYRRWNGLSNKVVKALKDHGIPVDKFIKDSTENL